MRPWLALLLALLASPAHAQTGNIMFSGFAPSSSTCPYADQAASDGCSGAPVNGSFQDSNYYTVTGPQSGQTYDSPSFGATINGSGLLTVSGVPSNTTAAANSSTSATAITVATGLSVSGSYSLYDLTKTAHVGLMSSYNSGTGVVTLTNKANSAVSIGDTIVFQVIANHETIVGTGNSGIYVGSNGTGNGGNGTYNLVNASTLVFSGSLSAKRRAWWDQACVDFACGPSSAIKNCVAGDTSCDPAHATRAGCAYVSFTFGGHTWNEFQCGGANPDIENLNLALNNGVILRICGGAVCTSATGTNLTIKNIYVALGSNADQAQAGGQQGQIIIETNSNLTNETFTQVECAGNYPTETGTLYCIYDQLVGSAPGGCTKLHSYNVYLSWPQNPKQVNTGNCTVTEEFEYNINPGRAGLSGGVHGAYSQLGGGPPGTPADNVTKKYDTTLIQTFSGAAYTTMFSILGTATTSTQFSEIGTNAGHLGTFTLDHDVTITNCASTGCPNYITNTMSQIVHTDVIENTVITNNLYDGTGGLVCFANAPDTTTLPTAKVDNGVGGAGNTLTVTNYGTNGQVVPGGNISSVGNPHTLSSFRRISPYPPYAAIQPTCDGAPATGTGANVGGTYCVSGAPFSIASGTIYQQVAGQIISPITWSGNTNMIDGSPILNTGDSWASDPICYGTFTHSP